MKYRKLRIAWSVAWGVLDMIRLLLTACVVLASVAKLAADEPVRLEILVEKNYSSGTLARSANALIAMGEEKAVALLKQSAAPPGEGRKNGFDVNERIGWLCRLVFEPKGKQPLRKPAFGGLSLPVKTMPDKDWPHYPLAISEGVIFVLSEGYNLFGPPPDPRDYIDYCRKVGKFRKESYDVPSHVEAQRALDALITSSRWKNIRWTHNEPSYTYIFREDATVSFLKAQVKRIRE